MNHNYKNTLGIIRRYFEKLDAINTVYLFGSIVIKDIESIADIDIAMLYNINDFKFDMIEAMSYLGNRLGIEVDIVILNTASELLKHQVRKKNIILFCNDNNFRKRFDILSRKHFEDYLHIHKIYYNALKKEINSGG